MAKIKFRKATALPAANPANDGIWMIKGGGDTKFKYYVVSGGVITALNGISDAELTAAMALKQDKLLGNATQMVLGDGSLIDRNKAAVGLNNVDNTSDANKPISTATQSALDEKITVTEKGVANGVATLGSDGKVPSTQLPSYVDDVLEFENLGAFPGTGETGKIYVALDTDKQYRWSGSAYVHMNKGDVTEMSNFFVRYDQVQTLSTGQKTQGRGNIGAADDAAVVKLTGAQTVSGVKTFSLAPKSSVDAAVAEDLVRLSQVQSMIGTAELEWAGEEW